MSNSTQNDEIKQIEKAIDEGFAESEKFLKGMKTPFDKPTQNDWEDKWDRLEKFIYYQNMFDGSDGKRDCVDFFMAKKLVRELLADARKEECNEGYVKGQKEAKRKKDNAYEYGKRDARKEVIEKLEKMKSIADETNEFIDGYNAAIDDVVATLREEGK